MTSAWSRSSASLMSAPAGMSVRAKAAKSTMIASWCSRMNALSDMLDISHAACLGCGLTLPAVEVRDKVARSIQLSLARHRPTDSEPTRQRVRRVSHLACPSAVGRAAGHGGGPLTRRDSHRSGLLIHGGAPGPGDVDIQSNDRTDRLLSRSSCEPWDCDRGGRPQRVQRSDCRHRQLQMPRNPINSQVESRNHSDPVDHRRLLVHRNDRCRC